MFSPATPSANLSIATPMTKDIKEQQPSTDDKVLEAAILGLDPYPVETRGIVWINMKSLKR